MLRAASDLIYPIFRPIYQAFSVIYSWTVSVFNSLRLNDGLLRPLLPFFVISVAVVLIVVAIRLIRKVVWGD